MLQSSSWSGSFPFSHNDDARRRREAAPPHQINCNCDDATERRVWFMISSVALLKGTLLTPIIWPRSISSISGPLDDGYSGQQSRSQMQRQDRNCGCRQVPPFRSDDTIEIGNDCAEHSESPRFVLTRKVSRHASHQQKARDFGRRSPGCSASSAVRGHPRSFLASCATASYGCPLLGCCIHQLTLRDCRAHDGAGIAFLSPFRQQCASRPHGVTEGRVKSA